MTARGRILGIDTPSDAVSWCDALKLDDPASIPVPAGRRADRIQFLKKGLSDEEQLDLGECLAGANKTR